MKEGKTTVVYVHNPIDTLIEFQELLIKNLRSEIPPYMMVMMQDILSLLKADVESCVQIRVDGDLKN